MILIVVKFPVRPDRVADWPALVADFTAATRAEPGNIFFEWSQSLEDPNEFVLVEAFADDGAGPHVNSEHFKAAVASMPAALSATPKIVNLQGPGDGWGPMAEMQVGG
jgi:quinol monooxygenase YgiN